MSRRPAGRNRAIKLALYLAAFLGLSLAIYLIASSGAAAIWEAMTTIGWGLAAASAFHLGPLLFNALSWRALLPRGNRLGMATVVWIRWIRESINGLLPVGQVGGDFVCVRLAHLKGVPAAPATASMSADVTVSVFSQMIFVALGLGLLVWRSTDPTVLAIVWIVLAGMGIMLVAMLFFIAAQRAGMFAFMARIAARLSKSPVIARVNHIAADIDAATRAVYRDKRAFWTSMGWRVVDWVVGAGEIWLLMYFLGKPVSFADALILESLGSAVRTAAFLVPGAIGILEASYVVFGGLFGISAADSLALALGKRVRELLFGIPGLISWQVYEGRRLLKRDGKAPVPGENG